MTERSTLSDTDILRLTTFSEPDDKGRVQLKITLPSGRAITSTDRLVRDEVKGKVLIQWTNSVREQDALDKQERAEQARLKAAAKRESGQHGDAPSGDGATAGRSTTSPSASTPGSANTLPDDPGEMIKAKLTHLLSHADLLNSKLTALSTELAETQANIAKWTRVAEGLGIDLNTAPADDPEGATAEGGDDDSTTDKEPEPGASGGDSGGSTDVRSGPAQGAGKRRRRGPRSKRSAQRPADRDSAGGAETVGGTE